MYVASPPRPQGFYAVVCTPAPIEDGADLLDTVRAVVRHSRGAVLISSATTGRAGMVWVARRLPDGTAVQPAKWFGPISTMADAQLLCDWLAIGGPLAPVPDALDALHESAAQRPVDRSPRKERRPLTTG